MEAGDDVAVGVVELHEREDTAAQLDALELVPARRMRCRGTEFDEMDQAPGTSWAGARNRRSSACTRATRASP
ncbi:hypothetical protein [Kitasatospora sp. NPDC001175]|uniref:hypothetical protein n=1 Tax=Kitasatospora sp. NPDC001175 TaxID=3157103 RepID=UPI003CFE07A3